MSIEEPRRPFVLPVEAGEEFRAMTRAEVMAALVAYDPANAIIREIARLVESYLKTASVLPARLVDFEPGSFIEAAAMNIAIEVFRQTVAEDHVQDGPDETAR
jgi:hypothetical protein